MKTMQQIDQWWAAVREPQRRQHECLQAEEQQATCNLNRGRLQESRIAMEKKDRQDYLQNRRNRYHKSINGVNEE